VKQRWGKLTDDDIATLSGKNGRTDRQAAGAVWLYRELAE